jgi:excisionase family DNA binding protein
VDSGDSLLTPGEVANLFRVDPKTVTRWAAAGRISSIRTPGGHRRFLESEVRALLGAAEPATPAAQPTASVPPARAPRDSDSASPEVGSST